MHKGRSKNILLLLSAAALLLAAADTAPTTGVTPAPKKKSTSPSTSKATPGKPAVVSGSKAPLRKTTGATGTKAPPTKSAATPSPKAPPAKSTSTQAKSGVKKKSVATRKAAPPTWHATQRAPTPERYKEIQQALASKGYLHPETPSGVWDNTSVDALKKFQEDQNLEPSGKLDSLSIIALGLGPKHDSPPSSVPAPGPDLEPKP